MIAPGPAAPAAARPRPPVGGRGCDRLPPARIIVSVTAATTFAIAVPDSLIARARAGESAAFEQIYRLFERPVYTLALRLLGDREEAQEVLHDAMLQIFRTLQGFRGDAPFWAWLRRIATNEALMRLRRRGRLRYTDEVPEDTELLDNELLPPAAADAQRLVEAMDGLPETARTVLWLYHAEGYTHEEIGALMGRSTSFSKSQLARGTRRLRELLHLTREVDSHA